MKTDLSLHKLFILIVWFLAFAFTGNAQPGCPNITTGPNQVVDCNVTCVDLTATVLETGATTSYSVASTPYAPPAPYTGGTAQFINTDDIWGSVINLPFNFCFYGNVYSALVIGANGLLTFDLTVANQGCAWSYTASCPTPGPPPAGLYNNSIMGAYHDIDPSEGGDISYFIQGTAPCRMFIVSFNDVPHYDCDCGFFSSCKKTTQQIVLYETTNVIEVYLQKKETCNSWNSGNAVIGIQDITGTNGVTPPGRNTGSWAATNEAWRFTPNGAPNFEVTWYDDNATQVGTGLTVNVCPSTTTTYTAEAVYTNCDQAVVTVTDQVTVTQNSTVSVTVDPTTVDLCPNETVTLTASSPNPGMTYTWSPAAGLSSTTGASVDATPTTSTLYTVTGSDGSCSASANATVNVAEIQLTSSSTEASCSGDDGTATVTPSGGTAPYTYAWNTTPAQTTQTATGLAAGDYDVIVTDATGCSQTTTVTVSFGLGSLSQPTMTSTDAVCTAANGTATATPVDGNPPYTYSWDTNPVQTTQTAVGLAAGIYTVTLTDNGGCQSTASVTVGADPGNMSASINISSDVTCNGLCDGEATVTIQNGTPPYLNVWDDPANQTTVTATDLCANTYNVGVADANGCLATAQVVISEPTAMVVNASMDQQSSCGQPDGQVSVIANGGTVANDYQYSWSSTPVQNTAVATLLGPAIYTVTVTDDNGCVETDDVEVTATPGFTASIASVTDASCFQGCDGEIASAISNGAILPVSYSWNSSPAQTTAVANNLCAGDYELTVTDDAGCISSATATVAEPTPVSSQLATSQSPICIGESSDLTGLASGGTPPYATYFWVADPIDATLDPNAQNPTVSPVVTTTYTFIATDANGCSSIPKFITVEVHPPLSLEVTRPLFSPDTAICPYDSATINLQANGGDGAFDYFLAPDLTNPITLPIVVQPNTTTTYDFTVTDGCTTPPAFASSTVTVFALPEVDFSGEELSGCDPHTVEFTDQTSPTPIAWNWDFGDPSSVANESNLQSTSHLFSSPGLYSISLLVESADGCVADSTKEEYIEVFPLPVANFSLSPEVVSILEASIQFTDLSTGNIDSWNWDFGDGGNSFVQNPSYIYSDTGTYSIWLQVVTVDGCEDETSRQVIIEPDFMFYVPNSFTPNDDGRNDSFRGYGEGVDWDSYELFIYDRWGEEIFVSRDIDTPWKGWYKNAEVEVGVYIWMIRIFDLKGDQHTYRGHVTLLR